MGEDRRPGGAFAPPRRDSQTSIVEDVPFALFIGLENQEETDLQFPYHSPHPSVSTLFSSSFNISAFTPSICLWHCSVPPTSTLHLLSEVSLLTVVLAFT